MEYELSDVVRFLKEREWVDLTHSFDNTSPHFFMFEPAEFMVRKMNHRFKNILTMNSSVCNAVMMCHRERYGHKMAFSERF